jgi:hypothetical protein
MTKIRKQKRKKKYRYNVNRKKVKRRRSKLPSITWCVMFYVRSVPEE